MMHAARPYEYFEDAFLAWLDRECGGYESLRAGGDDFVMVRSQCRYIAPARLGDRIDLAVRPFSVEKRSSFTVEVEMARPGQVLTRCTVTYVTVRNGRPSPLPWPLRQAIPRKDRERSAPRESPLCCHFRSRADILETAVPHPGRCGRGGASTEWE
jgi:acyl-CoA thioester hydrolase/thioesterase-3